MANIKPLRPGDPCPCCGQPIVTRDPQRLWLLGWVSHYRRLPTSPDEINYCLEEMEKRNAENAPTDTRRADRVDPAGAGFSVGRQVSGR